MDCDTCKMKRACDELERMGKVPKHEKCRCYSQAKPTTHADAVRAMSDEELAQYICKTQYREGDVCPPTHNCAVDKSCEKCWLDWLKQEVEA